MAFDKIKQLTQMRQQAKELQRELEQIEEVYEKKNVKVKVNGAQQITYLEIDGEENEFLKNVINDAMKSVQKKSAKRMLEMGGGLSGLFGGN